MALRRPYIVDEMQYVPAPVGGWNPDANPWELSENQAPILDNAIFRPGRVAVRGALVNWADATGLAPPVPFYVAGVQPVPGTTSLFIGRKTVSSTAYVDPWFAPVVRPSTAAKLGTTVTSTIALGGTSFTSAPTLIPGPRGTTFEGTRLYISYGTSTSPVQDTAATYFAQSTNVVALSSAGTPTAYTNAPRGAIDIKGYLSRIFLLGGIDDPASGTTFNPLTLFWSNPLNPGGGNSASFADWKDPITGFTNKTTMDGDTTDPGIGLAVVRSGLLILRANSVWILRGTTTASFTLLPVSRQAGCVDPRSIVETDRGVYFMSPQGLMLTDGVTIVNVSGNARYTLQAAVGIVGGSIRSSFGGYVTSAVTNSGQLVISMGVPSVTSGAPDGHIQPVWCGMFDPATNAWTRITSQLFVADGNIVQAGNNYPGWVFNTPDRRLLSIGDKYITQWEAATSSTALASFNAVGLTQTAAVDTSVGDLTWTNPNLAKVLDGSSATSVVTSKATALAGAVTQTSTGGLPTWTNLNLALGSGTSPFATVNVTSAAPSQDAQFDGFGFAIPTHATITGVTVVAGTGVLGGAGTNTFNSHIMKAGTEVGTLHTASWISAPTTVGSAVDLWGTTLTPSDVNNSGFGVAIQCATPSSANVEITSVQITVAYTVQTNLLQVTNYGFAIPSTATITGIQATVTRAASGTIRDGQISLYKAGALQATNKATATTWPGTLTAATYGGSADLWGTTWAPSDINNSGFGVGVAAQDTNDTSVTASVDAIQLTVFYTIASSTQQQSFAQQTSLYDTDSAGNFQLIPFRWRTTMFPVIGTNTSTRKTVSLRRWLADYVFQGIGLASTNTNGFTVTPITAAGTLVPGAGAVLLPPTNNSMTAGSVSGGPPVPSIAIERVNNDLFSEATDVAFDVTAAPAYVNLVPNSSFESDTAGGTAALWSTTVPGWFLTTGGSQQVLASALSPFGSKLLNIGSGAAANEGAAVPLGVLPAGTYNASMYVSGFAGETLQLFAGIISPGTGNGLFSFSPATGGVFGQVSVTFTADGSTACYVGIRSTITTPSPWFIDGVQVTAGSTLLPYVDGNPQPPSAVTAELYGIGLAYLPSRDLR